MKMILKMVWKLEQIILIDWDNTGTNPLLADTARWLMTGEKLKIIQILIDPAIGKSQLIMASRKFILCC